MTAVLIHTLLTLQWFFLLYFVALNGGYVLLNLTAIFSLVRYMPLQGSSSLPQAYAGMEPPISLLVPAYNEATTICSSVRSLLQLNYPEFEVIVINDGSTDDMLDVLRREFSLAPFPEAYRVRLPTQPVQTIYQSARYTNLRVIDKANGGKADALNAGINCARFPLYCAMDADSVLNRDSLQHLVQPFLDDPRTIACGGTVRIANGCEVEDGFLTRAGLPSNLLALFQTVEYLRAFLFGRLGWSPMNAMLIISGAFGLFRKDSVVAAGGYRTDTVGEDMELVVRLHRFMRNERRDYRITFVPDPICWTESPEDLKTLRKQRMRWQRGLAESLRMNIGLLFHRRGGAVGWLGFPFMALFEWWGPCIEVIGFVFVIVGYSLGIVSHQALIVFLLLALAVGILLSISAILLEEMSFHIYPKASQLLVLMTIAVLENFGYRQINSIWRFIAMLRWLTGGRGDWGTMKRTGNWQRPASSKDVAKK